MSIPYDELAAKHGFSREAVYALAEALRRGGGLQAQFNHPELGGMGQWMPTMVMIGDMFNTGLKARVDALCHELAAAVRADMPATPAQMPPMSNPQAWWPAELGQPSMQGAQNNAEYAYFPTHNRLAVRGSAASPIQLYDTSGYQLSGVSQQQGPAQTLTFQTPHGQVSLSQFTRIR